MRKYKSGHAGVLEIYLHLPSSLRTFITLSVTLVERAELEGRRRSLKHILNKGGTLPFPMTHAVTTYRNMAPLTADWWYVSPGLCGDQCFKNKAFTDSCAICNQIIGA